MLLTDPHSVPAAESRVVAHLAHELRQPLSAMEAIAFYLEMTAAAEPEAAAQIEKLQRLISHASWILSDAVHFTQATPPRLEPQDLNQALLAAADRVAVGEADRLEFVLTEDLPPVHADGAQLAHLLAGVLYFCLRSTPSGQPLTLASRRRGPHAAVEIQAPAPGLSAADLAPIFEPFHEHPAAGSGLGLASVRRIAEVHGGHCHLEMTAENLLRLTLTLPLSPDPAA